MWDRSNRQNAKFQGWGKWTRLGPYLVMLFGKPGSIFGAFKSILDLFGKKAKIFYSLLKY